MGRKTTAALASPAASDPVTMPPALLLALDPARICLLEAGFADAGEAGRAARLVAGWNAKYGQAVELVIFGDGPAQRVLATQPRQDRLVDAVVEDCGPRMREGDATGYVVTLQTWSGLVGQVFVPEAAQRAAPELLYPGAVVRVLAPHIRPVGMQLCLGPQDTADRAEAGA